MSVAAFTDTVEGEGFVVQGESWDGGTGGLGDWGTGGLGDWETGGLGDWETGGLGDWETGGLIYLAFPFPLSPKAQSLKPKAQSLKPKT